MRIKSLGRGAMLSALAAGTLLAAGCATETPYRPAVGQGFYRTGFSERQVEPNRFIVSFSGNTVTPRDTVERYLLFRAAELTVGQGYDYFVMVDRDVDRQSRTYSTPGVGYGWGYGGFGGFWGPRWNYWGRGFGYRSWSPFYGDPFWGDTVDIRTVDRFEATAEIVMERGPIPKGNVRAFDAHAVQQTLGPTIVLPGQETGRRR
jgi:hypothetical protein